MIITISGEPGSGKTLTMIKLALMECQNKKVLHNIRGMKTKYITNQHLLCRSDLFVKEKDDMKSNSKTERFKLAVNWQFLQENSGSTFMLDEAHKLFYSRNFMSAANKCASELVGEIRKICKDSGNFSDMRLLQRVNNGFFTRLIYDCVTLHNNLYVTSQTTSKIEKDVRDLSQIHIHCHAKHISGHMFVYNDFYFIDAYNNALEKFESGEFKPKRSMFYANPFFEMYDRFAVVDMRGESL